MFKFTCDEFIAQLKKITGKPYTMAVDCSANISNIFKEAGVRDFKEFPEKTFLGIPELQTYFTKNTGRGFDDSYVDVDLTFSAPKSMVKATYEKEKSEYEYEDRGIDYYTRLPKESLHVHFSYTTGSIEAPMETMPTFYLKAKFPFAYALKDGSKLFEHSGLRWQWWHLPSDDETKFQIVCPDKNGRLSVDPTKPKSNVPLTMDEKSLEELPFTSQDASTKTSGLEIYPALVRNELFLRDKDGHYCNIDIVSVDGKSKYQVLVFEAKATLKEALENIEKSR